MLRLAWRAGYVGGYALPARALGPRHARTLKRAPGRLDDQSLDVLCKRALSINLPRSDFRLAYVGAGSELRFGRTLFVSHRGAQGRVAAAAEGVVEDGAPLVGGSPGAASAVAGFGLGPDHRTGHAAVMGVVSSVQAAPCPPFSLVGPRVREKDPAAAPAAAVAGMVAGAYVSRVNHSWPCLSVLPSSPKE